MPQDINGEVLVNNVPFTTNPPISFNGVGTIHTSGTFPIPVGRNVVTIEVRNFDDESAGLWIQIKQNSGSGPVLAGPDAWFCDNNYSPTLS